MIRLIGELIQLCGRGDILTNGIRVTISVPNRERKFRLQSQIKLEIDTSSRHYYDNPLNIDHLSIMGVPVFISARDE